MKVSRAYLLTVLTVFLVPTAIFAQYRWPLYPPQGPRGISGTLAEFRPGGGGHLHEGVDMPAAWDEAVYLVQGGVVTLARGQSVEIDGHAWAYRHVHNQRRYVDPGYWYPANHHAADVRRLIEHGRDITHLHFEEGGGGGNPLVHGHLQGAPAFDTEWPRVIDMWFQQDNSARCLPEEDGITTVRGRIDIVSRAQDAMPSPGSARVGLYRMWYRIRDRYLPTIHKGREKFSKKS